jgi:hypothetical protein
MSNELKRYEIILNDIVSTRIIIQAESFCDVLDVLFDTAHAEDKFRLSSGKIISVEKITISQIMEE